jgi:hypothetical protein
LRQGDPISSMLFLLVIDVLNGLFRRADSWSLFKKLPQRQLTFCVSIYADDLVMFLNPA